MDDWEGWGKKARGTQQFSANLLNHSCLGHSGKQAHWEEKLLPQDGAFPPRTLLSPTEEFHNFSSKMK